MPVEIVPHLWLGDYKDAEHVSPNVRLVVNCTRNVPFFGENTTNIRIPVDDLDDEAEQASILSHWTPGTFASMLNTIMQGHDVLVHCQMGRQRSAATMAAFLMTGGKSKTEAMDLIRSKKREAFFPRANFEQALIKFESLRSNVGVPLPVDSYARTGGLASLASLANVASDGPEHGVEHEFHECTVGGLMNLAYS